ncbi:MAG: hypothetical protein A2X94_10200 [Bdellovibrionales bacterium GWB1_55_8]|nr:MAG: hypothetical protein A2X94_10200 [Bdellovibrionales bacterium GWB1_55_8]
MLPDDIQQLLPLISEFNQAEQIDTPPARIAPALETLLRDPSLGVAWFIHVGGVCAGYAVLTFGYDLEYAGRVAWVTDFYLREKYRERGMGTQALAALEEEARRFDVNALHLMVFRHNHRAVKVYTKRGFVLNPREAMLKLLDEGLKAKE